HHCCEHDPADPGGLVIGDDRGRVVALELVVLRGSHVLLLPPPSRSRALGRLLSRLAHSAAEPTAAHRDPAKTYSRVWTSSRWDDRRRRETRARPVHPKRTMLTAA